MAFLELVESELMQLVYHKHYFPEKSTEVLYIPAKLACGNISAKTPEIATRKPVE
jgi:hypothetical protein